MQRTCFSGEYLEQSCCYSVSGIAEGPHSISGLNVVCQASAIVL